MMGTPETDMVPTGPLRYRSPVCTDRLHNTHHQSEEQVSPDQRGKLRHRVIQGLLGDYNRISWVWDL